MKILMLILALIFSSIGFLLGASWGWEQGALHQMELDAPAKAYMTSMGLELLRSGEKEKGFEHFEGLIDFELGMYRSFKDSPKSPLLPYTVHSDMAEGSMEFYVEKINNYRAKYGVNQETP